METEAQWSVTVVFGKDTAALPYSPQSANSVDELKDEITRRFGVTAAHQRLVFKGRELRNGQSGSVPPLADKCKIMLLLNRQYYVDHPAGASTKKIGAESNISRENASDGSAVVTATQESTDTPHTHLATATASAGPSTAARIDVETLDSDSILVELVRGKSSFELVFSQESHILAVKEKASALLGLSSPQAIRLVVKGKTPADATTLADVSRGKRTLKCMLLLQAQQHTVMEKEGEFRELLNELTQLQSALRRTEKQMARNFTSREESLLQLSTVVDRAEHVSSNLELLELHLGPSGSASDAAKPRANAHTLATLKSTVAEAKSLVLEARALLDRHSST